MNATDSYFSNVPNESDTTILRCNFKNIHDIPVLLQVWAWDGLTACSAVIPEEFSSQLGENELLQILREEVSIGDAYTVMNDGHYTFVNYGFCQ